jgi:hypothetical protein
MPTTEETKYQALESCPVVLSICTDLDRTTRRERALSAAGFRVVSANTFQAASAMSQYCPFRVVVLDHECCSELASLVLGTPYVILDTEPQANEEDLVQDLLALCARRGWFNKLEPLRAA